MVRRVSAHLGGRRPITSKCHGPTDTEMNMMGGTVHLGGTDMYFKMAGGTARQRGTDNEIKKGGWYGAFGWHDQLAQVVRRVSLVRTVRSQ